MTFHGRGTKLNSFKKSSSLLLKVKTLVIQVFRVQNCGNGTKNKQKSFSVERIVSILYKNLVNIRESFSVKKDMLFSVVTKHGYFLMKIFNISLFSHKCKVHRIVEGHS